MARNATVDVPAGEWTQLTNADAEIVTFQNVGGALAKLSATADETAPTTDAGALSYNPGQGEKSTALADLFPGLASPVRLWAFGSTRMMISHA